MEYLLAWIWKERKLVEQGKKVLSKDEETVLKYVENLLNQVKLLLDTKMVRRTKNGNFELAQIAELQGEIKSLKNKSLIAERMIIHHLAATKNENVGSIKSALKVLRGEK